MEGWIRDATWVAAQRDVAGDVMQDNRIMQKASTNAYQKSLD
jgi:hypothetical protein